MSNSNFAKVNVSSNLLKKAKTFCGTQESKQFLNVSRFSDEAFRRLIEELREEKKK